MRIIIVLCALFVMQTAYCQPSKIRGPAFYRAQVVQEPCTWAYYCYWQRYCQAERGWYETMEYPSYRRWPLLARITR